MVVMTDEDKGVMRIKGYRSLRVTKIPFSIFKWCNMGMIDFVYWLSVRGLSFQNLKS